MSQNSPVANGLLHIHKLLTRSLRVIIKKCDEYISKKQIPADEIEGFNMYVTTFIRVMHAHHMGEDEVVFPVVKERIEAPYSVLLDDHAKISGILDKLEKELPEVSGAGLVRFRTLLGEIDKMWGPHIRSEENSFTTHILDSTFSKTEQQSLSKRVATHGQKSSGPGPVTLPFIFYNLEPDERKEFTRDFPWILKSFLIPVIWKKKWQPMKPFLLN
jgi:hemerythrin-like domain-containing protein